MRSYLKNRKQRTQINNNFIPEKNIIAGVPQGSIDGPLLFNLFINDLIFFITTFLSNCSDGNSLYNIGKDPVLVNCVLVKDFRAVKEWFYENFMYLIRTNVTICALEKILKVIYLNLKKCVFRKQQRRSNFRNNY